MTSRRSFLRSLSLLPLAPMVIGQVAVEAAAAAPLPEPQQFYHYEKPADPKMIEFLKRYEKAIMAGEYSTYGPALAQMTRI